MRRQPIPRHREINEQLARHYGLVAVTDNLHHFSRMPGVLVENWVSRPPS